jgi:hypothetical protein
MMPLWTTATVPLQSRWGWAFGSLGAPQVAHLVCPTPSVPLPSPLRFTTSAEAASSATLPARLTTQSPPGSEIASPAES